MIPTGGDTSVATNLPDPDLYISAELSTALLVSMITLFVVSVVGIVKSDDAILSRLYDEQCAYCCRA